jgi:hypothetical protein
MHLNKKNNHYVMVAAAATLFTLAMMTTSSMMGAPAAATTTNTTTTTTGAEETATTPSAPSSSSGIDLSPQPIYEERSPPGIITPINETHGVITFSGNGVLTLPNTTQTFNTTHNGTAVISFTTSSGQGKETIRTEDGETVTATLYEIVQFNNPAAQGGVGKGIVTAVFQTNSTGILSPLNGVIAVGVDDLTSNDASHITLWQWESGIPRSALPLSANGTIGNTTNTNSTTTTAE